MKCKSIIIILFLGLTSQAWSQKSQQIKLDDKLVSVISKSLLFNAETDPVKKVIDLFGFVFSPERDSINSCEATRYNIIQKACNYIGVSYRYGQSSEKGFDCSGYVKFIYQKFGLSLPHSSYAQYKMSKHLDNTEAQTGDLVFFITRGKSISHVGIYLGNNQFIHSPGRGQTVSVDSLGAGYYKRHLVGFGSVLN